jgi:hypothetical protein
MAHHKKLITKYIGKDRNENKLYIDKDGSIFLSPRGSGKNSDWVNEQINKEIVEKNPTLIPL